MLDENEMSNITSSFVVAMRILDVDLKDAFKHKDGVVGKFRNAANRPIESLFSDFIRKTLGLTNDADCMSYIEMLKQNIKEEIAKKDHGSN